MVHSSLFMSAFRNGAIKSQKLLTDQNVNLKITALRKSGNLVNLEVKNNAENQYSQAIRNVKKVKKIRMWFKFKDHSLKSLMIEIICRLSRIKGKKSKYQNQCFLYRYEKHAKKYSGQRRRSISSVFFSPGFKYFRQKTRNPWNEFNEK